MATLIAIGYPDEVTGSAAAEEAQRLAGDLSIEAESIAVIRRDREGRFHATTCHHAVAQGAGRGMFWSFLFDLLFFAPVLGMTVGTDLDSVMVKLDEAGLYREFQGQVRDMLQPGTSALFLVVDKVTTDKVVATLGAYGGTMLMSSLSEKAVSEVQKTLRGSATRL